MLKPTPKRGLLIEFLEEWNVNIIEKKINPTRIFELKEAKAKSGPVVYWMSRDQRVNDNWSLLFAQQKAIELKQPLIVIFCLVDNYLEATIRQYDFMIVGLKEVEKNLREKNIPFYLLEGNPSEKIATFIKEKQAGVLVTDFDPLKIKREWTQNVSNLINIPFYEVDAHNICPCRFISNKAEIGARTLRPKIYRLISDFLTEFPTIKKQSHTIESPLINWQKIKDNLNVDKKVKEVDWLKPSEKEAKKVLINFIENKLNNYDEKRNNPNFDGQSNLSPYLHFGQISSQRIAIEVLKSKKNRASKEAFLEELIVRKELSDNFCFYNQDYDNFNAFPLWAKDSLNAHKDDLRTYIYSCKDFERAKTHDDLWNAAQIEMVERGKMHGYMRMYWCKKILEWSSSPQEAQKIAIYLNDKYEIDGRDPNGYTGISWSIGGTHDRAWKERSTLGKVRYMSYNGCAGKFDVNEYINKYVKKHI